jgi:hypothetical protein
MKILIIIILTLILFGCSVTQVKSIIGGIGNGIGSASRQTIYTDCYQVGNQIYCTSQSR